jgi:para-aminobenzoate synthetase / 4-amino-4-deoxychorismate lyase
VRRFELIETLLFEPSSGFALLNEHLERLQRSAAYFGFPYDQTAVLNTLMSAIKDRRAERLRVRMLLAENGTASVTMTPLPPADPNAVMRYVISPTRLKSSDPFLYHKTTRRELYDTEWEHFSKTAGSDEVIYLNEHGELAEGSRTTIFIERNGKLETPPLLAGLLPGTLRAHLIAEGRAVERSLKLADLTSGDPVYLGNSVRGLVRAEPIPAKA